MHLNIKNMKKSIYISALALLALSFSTSSAKAYDNHNNYDNHGHDNNNGGCTNMPINSGVVYLMIAGIALGTVAVSKSKSTTALKA
jgi:hypothetical protein